MFEARFPFVGDTNITLKQSLERERLIAKTAQLGIWEYEVGTEKVYLDARGCEIYGVDPVEFGRTVDAWIALLHPKDRDATARRMLAFRDGTDEMLSTNFRVISPNSGLRFIHLDAHMERDEYDVPQRMFGVVRDVTDEQLFKQEIKERAQYTQTIIDSVVDGIVAIDTSGLITSFNPASETIFGRRSEEVIGQNVSILMPKYSAENHDSFITRYLSGAEPLGIGRVRELEGIRKSGEVFPMELAVTEFRQGGERGFVGIIRDITEQKHLERMKSEFLSTVSHELRTPLTSISAALGLLRGGAAGTVSESGSQLLDTAIRNSQRLARLIEDLLDLERLSVDQLDFHLAVHPIDRLLKQALDHNEVYACSRGITLEVIDPVPEVSIQVDDDRFVQILSNILSNAVKFSPEGARVCVEVTLDDGDVLCTVTDTGPGIPETFHEQLFEMFSQVDSSDTRNNGGAGVGLAISQKLAINMDGAIGYESAPQGGSCFWIRFPVATDAPNATDHPSP